jgi:hypothetical protein
MQSFETGEPLKLNFSPAQIKQHPNVNIFLTKKEHEKLNKARIIGSGCTCNISKSCIKQMKKTGDGLFMYGEQPSRNSSRVPPTQIIGSGLHSNVDTNDITKINYSRPMGFKQVKPAESQIMKQPPTMGSGIHMFGSGLKQETPYQNVPNVRQSYGAISGNFLYDY